ncbi:ABC transporter substrate-binding protein [Desulfosporosinus sp. FKB]|uniref:ABC transporter substrate-binding protein n=1 Tax=Desulfosporosinus sp. FKB TaxID=1969835 RepID=UPI000B4A30C6|nr:ABC transporter substrate-binding protein [Desulfosporosinus sp. FKB]
MKKSVRATLLGLLSFSVMLSSIGCGSQTSTSGNTANSNASKQIVIARNADSADLDPVNAKDNNDIWMENLFAEGLVQSSADGKKTEPALAKSWDVSADKLTYTFHIRDGLKFSDGTPVTGEDWIYSLKRARDTKSSQWAFALEDVKDVTAPDNTTVVITLKDPSAAILSDLSMFNASVMPKAYCEKAGDDGISQKPIGTGPYMISVWKKGEYILFKKNPNYWQKGKPLTDEIKVTVVPDDNSRIMQLEGGQIDVATNVPYDQMKTIGSSGKLQAVNLPSTEVHYITINTTKKNLNNGKVRQALEYATDKDALVKTILFGNGTKAISFLSSEDPHFDNNLPDAHAYNVDKAKDLLKEAGLPNGFEVSLVVPAGNSSAQQTATMLKEQWAKIGVTVNISQLENAAVSSQYKSLQYDIQLHVWTNDITDTTEWVDYACIYENDKNSFTGWKNDQIEAWAKQAKIELDENKRMALYKNIQEAFQNDAPLIPLYAVPYTVAMSKNITGFVQTPLGNYRFQDLARK